jgi:hypothetical protein
MRTSILQHRGVEKADGNIEPQKLLVAAESKVL